MELAKSTREKIKTLVKGIADSTPWHDFALQFSVPSLAANNEGFGLLSLSQAEAALYYAALCSLEGGIAVEHLSPAEVDEELILLMHDVRTLLKGNKDKSAIGMRRKRFEDDLARPLETYEVAVNVEGLRLSTNPLMFGEVVIQEFTPELADEWHLTKDCDSPEPWSWRPKFVGEPAGIVTVAAGSYEKARERARNLLDRAINILRVCIASFQPARIWDEQLLFRRGPFLAIRKISPDKEPVRFGWERRIGRFDTQIELSGVLAASTRESLVKLGPLYDGTIPDGLRDAILRSLEWIGTSITREQTDHKVVNLCTSLEAVLTSIDDAKKAEALALRLLLLSIVLNPPFTAPRETYNMYYRRSRAVHSAALGLCGQKDYFWLRDIAYESVLNIIELAPSRGPLSKPSGLISFLESQEYMDRAIEWLSKRQDKVTKNVTNYAKRRLQGK